MRSFLDEIEPAALGVVKAGLRMAILLFFCECLLLGFGDGAAQDTRYIFQNAYAMGQVAVQCLTLSAIGAVFVQCAAKRKNG